MTHPLRAIPSVDRVLQQLRSVSLPRPLMLMVVRSELAKLRASGEIPTTEETIARIREVLTGLSHARLQAVINGTGILIHTNLGRAPLGPEVVERITTAASHYCNLEYDLVTGERGARAAYLEAGLACLCEAEAATVVNNCAAALVLALCHFAREKREVIISRGELVQIGGGFRIPEILEASGARLREVGTTNQTSLDDYARAIGPETGLMLRVHRSNFYMGGFVQAPSTEQLSALAHEHALPFLEDLGSGALIDTGSLASLAHEPTATEVLSQGVDLVVFSGDKLLGGPQAGIIAGQAKLVTALKREPFFRALRCDKLVLAALEATVELYLREAGSDISTISMLASPLKDLRTRAERMVSLLKSNDLEVQVGTVEGQVGGGTLPQSILPSIALELRPRRIPLVEWAARLRRGVPPVVGCIAKDQFHIDLRTVFPKQDQQLIDAIRAALAPGA